MKWTIKRPLDDNSTNLLKQIYAFFKANFGKNFKFFPDPYFLRLELKAMDLILNSIPNYFSTVQGMARSDKSKL